MRKRNLVLAVWLLAVLLIPPLERSRKMGGRENGMQKPAGTYGHEHRPCFRRLSLF